MDGDEDADEGTDDARRRASQATHLQDVRSRRRMRAASADEAPELGDDDDDNWCEHGSDQHVMVHEAGHAVAALDNGIVFECIEVFGEGRAPDAGPARVRFADPDPACWASPRPTVGLQFALAGVLAEHAVLACFSDGSEKCDVMQWNRGVRLPADAEVSEQEAVLKCPFAEVRTTTRTWATGAADRIKAVADLLTQRRKRVPGDENLEVTYDEIRSLVPPRSTAG